MGISIGIMATMDDPTVAYCYSCEKDYTHLLQEQDGYKFISQEVRDSWVCDCGCDYVTTGLISVDVSRMDMGICYSTWADLKDHIGDIEFEDVDDYDGFVVRPEKLLEAISRVPGINEILKSDAPYDLPRLDRYMGLLHFMSCKAMELGRMISGA